MQEVVENSETVVKRSAFSFSAFDLLMIVLNLLGCGAAITLMVIREPRWPLVLLAVGTGLSSFARLAAGFGRGSAATKQ